MTETVADMKEKMVGPEVVADHLGVSEITVHRWARQGRIPSHVLTNKIRRFYFSEVLAAIKQKRAG